MRYSISYSYIGHADRSNCEFASVPHKVNTIATSQIEQVCVYVCACCVEESGIRCILAGKCLTLRTIKRTVVFERNEMHLLLVNWNGTSGRQKEIKTLCKWGVTYRKESRLQKRMLPLTSMTCLPARISRKTCPCLCLLLYIVYVLFHTATIIYTCSKMLELYYALTIVIIATQFNLGAHTHAYTRTPPMCKQRKIIHKEICRRVAVVQRQRKRERDSENRKVATSFHLDDIHHKDKYR